MNRQRLLIVAGTVTSLLLVSASVWASVPSGSEKSASRSIPQELKDRSWVQRHPTAAEDIKKIQVMYAQDPLQGLVAAAGALLSAPGLVNLSHLLQLLLSSYFLCDGPHESD